MCRYSGNTENACFDPKIPEILPKKFISTFKSISDFAKNNWFKYDGLNVCHCMVIVQIPKTHEFAPKLVTLDPETIETAKNNTD